MANKPPFPTARQAEPAEAPAPEREQVGDYLIGHTVGKGSFGKVRKGTHIPTGRTVALKVLNRQVLANANMDKKIRREIRILKLFNHPNICRLYDVVYTATDILVVMEYVDGGELYDYIVNNGKLEEAEARHIFQQIVCALEYCHHYRVVHRDLKPENILISKKRHDAKLIDFGLSNIMQDGDFLRTSCGSPNYAAPEVISGRLYMGPEVDVWSCGVVLYALLCGCLPFDEDNIPQLFTKIKKGKYSVPPHVSPVAKDLISQLLTVDAMNRATISQIRDHPWFTTRLPKYLVYRPSLFAATEYMDEDVLHEAARICKMDSEALRRVVLERASAPSSAPNSREVVVYHTLFDAKRQQEIEGGALSDVASSTGGSNAKPTTVFQRELNMGLMLTTSPALGVLLDTQDAAVNKKAYNATAFLPASVQDVARGVAPKDVSAASPGAFSFGNASSLADRVGSFQQSLTERSLSNSQAPLPTSGSSVRGRGQSILGGSHSLQNVNQQPGSGSKPVVGSVAKTQSAFSAEEEMFTLQNNCGWRIGLMTDCRSAIVMAEIYKVLKERHMEWKTVAPFLLAIRYQKTAPNVQGTEKADLVLHLHLMRIQEKHERGYVVDMRIVKGNTIPALSAAMELWKVLEFRLG